MTRSYDSPEAFRQALEQRLRDAASESGQALARLRQLLVFDRFLARVSLTFGDRAILKGGLVIELRLARARTTKDVDLRLVGSPDQALEDLRAAGRAALGDYLSYEIREDPRQPEIGAEGMLYEGRRYRARPLLAGKVYGSPFGVDIAFAEPMVGVIAKIQGSEFLRFAGVEPAEFSLYPVEAHVAEKLHAYTMPRTRPNSRVKDLPDLALLGMTGPVDGRVLEEAIRRIFESRGTHEPPEQVPVPPETWRPVYERLARIDGLPWPTIEDLTTAARTFLDPVLAGGSGFWDPSGWRWSAE